jgi:hypothetical protein
MSTDHKANLMRRLAPVRAELASHSIYDSLKDIEDVRRFMEYHVFAVWDFMSLLKSLQAQLTCVQVPWTPVGSPRVRRLLNEIVLEEETDVIDGTPVSHFELYRRAMLEIGADSGPIDALMSALRQGMSVDHAMSKCRAPAGASAFVKNTFAFIATGKPHVIAAAFTFGREEPIPDMFRTLIRALGRQENNRLQTLLVYLDRHIGLDEDHHAPMAVEMLFELCGNDRGRWDEAANAAIAALKARMELWSAIVFPVEKTRWAQRNWPMPPLARTGKVKIGLGM